MRETADLWAYEREARAQGYAAVCGVDEAGAGPLMGPVYAAAVILPEDCGLPELNDSKKLTEKSGRSCFPSSKSGLSPGSLHGWRRRRSTPPTSSAPG